jgi:glutamate decarboxylase
MDTIVFRVVLANPLTTESILNAVLEEQREIAQNCHSLLQEIDKLITEIR